MATKTLDVLSYITKSPQKLSSQSNESQRDITETTLINSRLTGQSKSRNENDERAKQPLNLSSP